MQLGASLKSWGRIVQGDSQMFYQLFLKKSHYLIKYYNQKGKLKFIRPIKFPSESVEIHIAGNYLLCCLYEEHEQSQNQIFLVDLTDLRVKPPNCNMRFKCKRNGGQAISSIYHNEQQQIIIFSDHEQNIYMLRINGDSIDHQFVYKNDKIVKRIQMDNRENVMRILLVTQQRRIKVLILNEESFQLQNVEIKYNYADYYYRHTIQVQFYDDNVEKMSEEQYKQFYSRQNGNTDYLLSIENRKYLYVFPKDSQLIFYSNGKGQLIVFNKTANIIAFVINNMYKIYDLSQKSFILPEKLSENNFLVTHKSDRQNNVKLELRVYDEVKRIFDLYQFIVLDKNKPLPYLSFLKQNFQKIFHINGMIEPIHEQNVKKALKDIQQLYSDFQKSKEFYEEDLNCLDLGYKLMKNGLQYLPKQLNKIVYKVKNSITNLESTYCIIETRRLFQYCDQIQNQIVSNICIIFGKFQQNIKKSSKFNLEQQQLNSLNKSAQLVQNMINFLFLLLSQLQYEWQLIKINENVKTEHHLEQIEKSMSYYYEVSNSAKSIFLVIRLLLSQRIIFSFNERFRKIAEKQSKKLILWQKNHSTLFKMEYPPLFLHENFKTITTLFNNKKQPNFSQFITYLLKNRSNFVEVAYFYQYVIKTPAVPYLDSDISDFIENSWFHIEPIPQLEQKREKQEEDFLRIPNLIHKMAGTVLKLKEYSFIKYVIQLAITYQQYPLAVALIHSGSFKLNNLDLSDQREHIFMVKSLLLAGRFEHAYLYVLKNHSNQLFQEYVKWAKINKNQCDLLLFKIEKKFIGEDDKSVNKLLNLSKQKEQFLQLLEKKSMTQMI